MPDIESNIEHQPKLSRSSLSILGLAAAAGFLVCLLTLTGFAGGWFWMFELTSHFRIQYAVILLVLAVGFFCMKRWQTGATFLAFGLVNGVLLLPYLSFDEARSGTGEPTIKLLAWNVNSGNKEFVELTRLLDFEDPDIVLLMEVSPQWERFLTANLTSFPHQQVAARDDNFGIALLSKRPLENVRTLYLGGSGVPSIQAVLTINEIPVSFLGTHPLPPAGSLRSRLRDQQLDLVAEWVRHQTNATVVAGDLNVTPWSPIFQEFIDTTRLKNCAVGRGLHASWPAFFTPMLIPIDHFLHSDDVVVMRREIIDATGSDHLPQMIEFGTAKQALSP